MIFSIKPFREKEYNLNLTDYIFEYDRYIVIVDCNVPIRKKDILDIDLKKWLIDNDEEALNKNLKGGFFIIKYDNLNGHLTLLRDRSGIKTAYFYRDDTQFVVSTHLRSISVPKTEFNRFSIEILKKTDFIQDGHTIYNHVQEIRIGSRIEIDQYLNFVDIHNFKFDLAIKDNNLSLNENTKIMRDLTNKVHNILSGDENIVYLSGGIDSCVMLASLDDVLDKSKIVTKSYLVKGTEYDETGYALKMAKFLGYKLEVIVVDPKEVVTQDTFEEVILAMNNPYPGYWIFKPTQNRNALAFAGQDSRLHTPDVNIIDNFAFTLLINNLQNNNLKVIPIIFKRLHGIFNFANYKNNFIKYSDRIISSIVPEGYISEYIFKNIKSALMEFDDSFDYKIDQMFSIDVRNVKNKRHLYNEIVKIRWQLQYTDDIRYLQDMARMNNTHIALPFYDLELSTFASSIPYHWATKYTRGKDKFSEANVRVNKFILREAFKDKIPASVLYRKKAVSPTIHLFFNGPIGKIVQNIIKSDLQNVNSFIKSFGYHFMAQKFLSQNEWSFRDQEFLTKVYYMAAMCIYYKRI